MGSGRFFIYDQIMDEQWFENFKIQLDQYYAWPALYTFKFIVPAGKEPELKVLFPNHTSTERPSKNGNYTSITFDMMAPNSDAVIEFYKIASKIEGIIAL
jgi:putative lipoic acid-binding regulatory protein